MRLLLTLGCVLLVAASSSSAEEFRGKLALREGRLYLDHLPVVEDGNENAARLRADFELLDGRTIVVDGTKSRWRSRLTIHSIHQPRFVAREGYVLLDHQRPDHLVLWVHGPEVYKLSDDLGPLLRAHLGKQVVVRGWNYSPASEQSRSGSLYATGIRAQGRDGAQTNSDDVWITDPASEARVGRQAGTYQKVRGRVMWDADHEEFVLDTPRGVTRILCEITQGRGPMPLLGHYEGHEIEVSGLLLPPQIGSLGGSDGRKALATVVVERLLSPQSARLFGRVVGDTLVVEGDRLQILPEPPQVRRVIDGQVRLLPSPRMDLLLRHAESLTVQVSGSVFLDPAGNPVSLRPHSVRMEEVPTGRNLGRRTWRTTWVSLYDPQTDQVLESNPGSWPYELTDLRFAVGELGNKSNARLSGMSARMRGALNDE